MGTYITRALFPRLCRRSAQRKWWSPNSAAPLELNHPGDGRGAEQRPFRRKWISEPPRAVPSPSRSRSRGSAAAMEPAGLEQILRELLLPDTERIRRVRGRRDRARASRGLRERPDSDPQALPRPPNSSRPLFGTPPPSPRSATCWPQRVTLR